MQKAHKLPVGQRNNSANFCSITGSPEGGPVFLWEIVLGPSVRAEKEEFALFLFYLCVCWSVVVRITRLLVV
jgi:hypothetical protein